MGTSDMIFNPYFFEDQDQDRVAPALEEGSRVNDVSP